MGTFYDLKMHGTPDWKQWRKYLITVLILGFIIGFNDKSSTGLGITYIKNMIVSFIIVGFSIFFANLIGRIYSASTGYKSEYEFSINGLLIGLMLAFVSNGYFWYLSPGYQVININETGRLGYFRYGLRMCDWARAAAIVSFTHTALALIAHLSAQGNPIVDLFVKINIALGFYSMLPVPENNGLNLLFGQRLLWFFTIGAMAAVTLSMFFIGNIFLILFIGLVFAIIAPMVWIQKVE